MKISSLISFASIKGSSFISFFFIDSVVFYFDLSKFACKINTQAFYFSDDQFNLCEMMFFPICRRLIVYFDVNLTNPNLFFFYCLTTLLIRFKLLN